MKTASINNSHPLEQGTFLRWISARMNERFDEAFKKAGNSYNYETEARNVQFTKDDIRTFYKNATGAKDGFSRKRFDGSLAPSFNGDGLGLFGGWEDYDSNGDDAVSVDEIADRVMVKMHAYAKQQADNTPVMMSSWTYFDKDAATLNFNEYQAAWLRMQNLFSK